MTKLWERILDRPAEGDLARSWDVNQWISYLAKTSGLGFQQTWNASGSEEPPPAGFEELVDRVLKASPVIFTASLIRLAVFSQARFQWLREDTGQLIGDPSLAPLERPWAGGTTAKLLTRMEQHASVAGNAYVIDASRVVARERGGRRGPQRLTLMRPDWVTIVLGSQLDPDHPAWQEDAELVGFAYLPGGVRASGQPARLHLPDEVAHFAPIPDPLAHYRGMSWLTPILREAQGDRLMTEHKLKFFDHAATPNIAITFDPKVSPQQVKQFKELLDEEHQGLQDAYKTLYLGGGADVEVVGTDLSKMDFRHVQGKAETRILMAAGVHPTLAGASEGMQGSSLNAGNFGQTRRIFSDVHLQHLWSEAAASLEVLLSRPAGPLRLAVDTRNIPFMQDDQKDQAEIQASQARAITQYVREGYTPESAVAAIAANDPSLLQHTGMVSVQLHKPGAGEQPPNGGDTED